MEIDATTKAADHALEAAALKCEDYAGKRPGRGAQSAAYWMAKRCAIAIREMKSTYATVDRRA